MSSEVKHVQRGTPFRSAVTQSYAHYFGDSRCIAFHKRKQIFPISETSCQEWEEMKLPASKGALERYENRDEKKRKLKRDIIVRRQAKIKAVRREHG